MADIIQVRRDTAVNWTSVNPTLAQGEFAVETDTNQFKIGDGATAWTGLAYVTQGPAATIAVGTTTTGAEGTSASVSNSGNSAAAVFDFTIPRGDTGAQGPQGDAATIAVGTTTTGAEGTNASVVNSGTSGSAVFDFTIPRGDTGATGPQGPQGPQGIQGPQGDPGTPGNLWTLNGLTAEYLAGGATVGGVLTATGGSSTDWNTAYGWGDHSVAGYATTTNFTSTGIDDNATSTAITIDSSQNVGIGTTSPYAGTPLHVRRNTNGVSYFALENTDTGASAGSSVQVSAGTGGDLRLTSYSAGHASQARNASLFNHNSLGSLLLGTNGSERMRIDSSGNVGIGVDTTSYSNTLVVDQGGNYAGAYETAAILVRDSTGSSNSGDYHGALSFSKGTGQAAISAVQTTANVNSIGLAFWTHPSSTGTAAAVEAMRIDHDGNVGINITNPTEKLHVGGNILATGNITAYSDARLKSDVQTLDGSKVYEMRGVSYIKDGEASSGVIAQELQKVAPELVLEGEEYLSVAYGNLVGYLIEAVKDLKAEVEELKHGVTDKRTDKS